MSFKICFVLTGFLSGFLLLCVGFSPFAWADTRLVLYPSNPGYRSDGRISGTLNGQAAVFEYQHTYHVESEGEKDFKANHVRFAADGPVNVNLTVNSTIHTASLRTVGKDLSFTRNGSNLQFTLPGPGTYYLQLPDLNTPGRITYTVFFFFDDVTAYDSYQTAFAAAKNAASHGVVSHPSMDQTGAIQSLLNGRGAIYFPTGIYRTGALTLSSDTTLYLGAGAVLKGTDNYNNSRFLYTNGTRNVRIAGLGVLDANGHTPANMQTKGHGLDMESATQLTLEDVMFRDSNSWMLHIRRCSQVHFNNLKIFSGKDGIDPDGSSDVLIEGVTIQSIDDGFAVKSKFSGRNSERVTMRDCIVFSCASSLKIGTENYYGTVRDITWDHCDAVDADRACILYTNEDQGFAPISNITWRNIRIFNFPWQAETGGAPFQFHRVSDVSISGLLLENIVATPRINCSVAGGAGATFRNVLMNGSSSIPTQGMSFEGVSWPGITSQSRPIVFIAPSARNQKDYINGDEVQVNVQHPMGVAISSVELFINGISAGTRAASPWRFPLANLSPGTHVLTAKAIDANGANNSTAPYRIRIVQMTPGGSPTATPTLSLTPQPTPTPTATPTATSLMCPCAPGSSHIFVEQDGKVIIDAENYTSMDRRSDPEDWRFAASISGAQCRGHMEAANIDSGDTTFEAGARLNYEFRIITPGIYAIKLRRVVTKGTDDSCWVGIDGVQIGGIYDNSDIGQGLGWQWVSAGTFEVTLDAGVHTFNLVRRQKEYRVDRIMISAVGLPPDGSTETGECESLINQPGSSWEIR